MIVADGSTIEWLAMPGTKPEGAEPTTLAYLAGMIDGDGYITITRSCRAGRLYHSPQVGIAGTRPEPHRLAASIWGGAINRYVPKDPSHRPQFQWCRTGAGAATVIQAIFPYLLLKIDQAMLALELWEHLEFGRCEDPFPWFSPDYDPVAYREVLRAEAIELNQSRNRVGKKAAGRLLDGRTWDQMPEVRHVG
ncbi:hypothetical protein [Methylobacterium nodulans]|uniref:Homing endonuclease LAGLIDADG domain-containing protein n=1 Tax=Methylobacterium nodulans (strain LMG 21967 / CNCM I-2342 / ORS 2060) TaxID=460265 RepID=B8IH09_METNO|nr:hypothetical protein [Methylobacterium nodulans]ACL57884.1 hypothetical protein Mnod_2933 [Methylobacterium nodulans ORS 2060]